VGEASDILLIAVLTDDQVRDVLVGEAGLLSAAPRSQVIVVLSTAAIATIRWAAEVAEEAGMMLLDCGVSGGAGGLEAAAITAMVGGPDDAFARARPVLETFANPVLHMGPLGRGMAAKLARNLIVYTDWLVAWEAARLAEAAGVDVAKFVEAVEASDRWVGGHMAMVREGVGLATADDAARAKGEAAGVYARKDLRSALELGDELDLDLPAARLALERVASYAGTEKSLT
jgi:3-hydroxyisobutyrate dehydrogenase